MFRWAIRIVLVLVVLTAVFGVIVHVILRSDWLADTVLAKVSDKLGLEVSADSLSIGWGGTTSIRQTSVRMPLRDETILSAERITVEHAAIPLLICGRPANVRSVEISRPQVNLRQYEGGRWNVQDVWVRLKAALDSGRPRRNPTLPRVRVAGAAIQITEPNGVSQTLGPLAFQAEPQGQLVWAFDVNAPKLAGLKGRLLRGSDWSHEVGFAVDEIEPLIRDLLRQDISPIHIAGRWDGAVQGEGIRGTLRLDRVAVGPVALRGDVSLRATTDQITLSPRGLTISEPNVAGEPIRLTAGTVQIARERIEAERLAVEAGQVTGQLSGRIDPEARIGELSGSWKASLEGQPSRYYGTFQGALKSPRFGQKETGLSVTVEADSRYGTLSLLAKVEGTGADWRRSEWTVSAPTFLWSRGERQMDMTGATAELALDWPVVHLTSLHTPNAKRTSAEGQFDVNTRRWSARLEADALDLEAWGRKDINLLLTGEGDDLTARISELRIEESGRVIAAKGDLSYHERKLQDVHVSADWPAGTVDPKNPQAEQQIGHWHLEADVAGQVQPLSIEATGQLTGQNIALGKQAVGRVEIPVRAKADPEDVEVSTEPFDLLGGQWQLSGQYVRTAEVVQVNVAADRLSLEAAAGMAGLPLTSRGQADAQILLAIPNFDVQKAIATGKWNAQNVVIPPLEAEHAHGKLRIAGGLVRLDETVLEQGDGRAEASMEFRLDDPRILSVQLKTSQWPVRLESGLLALYADGEADLGVNIVEKTATGRAQVSGKLLWQDQDLARIRVLATVEGQTLNMQEIHAETLDGSIAGQARVPLNRWTDSVARLDCQGVQPRLLAQWLPPFERFEGIVSGSLAVERIEAKHRPPEPMRLTLDADIANGRYGSADIDLCHVIGHLGKDRLLIDEASFQVAGGQVNARARASNHVNQQFASLVTDFNDLDLNQLVHAIDPNAGEYVGLLSGRATVLSSAGQGVSLGGQAELLLTESDLVSSKVVRALHGTLNLKFGEQQPTGTGKAKIRLEGPSVIIPSFTYFNRGVEILAAGRIENVNLGVDSPVDGYAVGSTRMLKGIKLPGMTALDRGMASFLKGAASVRIGGTLDDVDVKVVPVPSVLGSVGRLLRAQVGSGS